MEKYNSLQLALELKKPHNEVKRALELDFGKSGYLRQELHWGKLGELPVVIYTTSEFTYHLILKHYQKQMAYYNR